MTLKITQYQPLFNMLPNAQTVIPFRLARTYEALFSSIYANWKDGEGILRSLQDFLGMKDIHNIDKILTAEQADSIFLACLALLGKRNFMIADKTGVGKGRILAGIARSIFKRKKKIIFITEKPALFHDFWRDLFDVQAHIFLLSNDVFMLGGEKVVINYPTPNVVYCKSPTAKQAAEWVEEKNTNFKAVFTTYSQITGVNGKKRLEYLCEFAKDAYLFCDEAHNSVGDTGVVREQLEKNALGVVYSSATIMNKAEHLRHFIREMNIDLKKLPTNFIENLAGVEDVYADFVGKILIKNGLMLRREHGYQMPHKTLFLSEQSEETLHRNMETFGHFINDLMAARIAIAKSLNPQSAPRQINADFWLKYGGRIDRIVRTMLLLHTLPEAISKTCELVKKGNKVALTMNSTFSSLIESLNKKQTGNKKFTLGEVLKSFVDDLEVDYPDCKNDEVLAILRADLINFIDTFDCFQMNLSIIDEIKEQVGREINQDILEISGRNNCVQKNQDGSMEWVRRTDEQDRNQIANLFNNYTPENKSHDVLVLTSAGAAGGSFHAGAKFTDQKPRIMIELERNPNSLQREQMFGRINRAMQVSLPKLGTYFPRHLTAFRIADREQDKLSLTRKLIASGAESEKWDLTNDVAEWAARHFLLNNPQVQQRIDIRLNRVRESPWDYPVLSRLLSRSYFLEKSEHDNFLTILMKARDMHSFVSDFHNKVRVLDVNDIQAIKTSRLLCLGKETDAKVSVRERLRNAAPDLMMCHVSLKTQHTVPLIDESILERRGSPLFGFLKFHAERTIFDYKEQQRANKNMGILRNVKIGDTLNFMLDGCQFSGVVTGAQTDRELPYPEFQVVKLRLIPNRCDAVITNDNEVSLSLNYLVVNMALKLECLSKQESEANSGSLKNIQVQPHCFTIALGHPLIVAWLLSLSGGALGRGEFIVDDENGESYPMLLLPSHRIDELRYLFTEFVPIIDEEHLNEIINQNQDKHLYFSSVDGQYTSTLSPTENNCQIKVSSHLHSDFGAKVQAKLAGLNFQKQYSEGTFQESVFYPKTTRRATLSTIFSYIHRNATQLFVRVG